jgi:hypothetical protein
MGFGVQASGPLSTKSAMSNMKFQGRQFAIATSEKREHDRNKRKPSYLLEQLHQKNISAVSTHAPYKPLSTVEKLFRKDLSLGVRRTKAGGAITHQKTPIKRSAFFEAFRQDDYQKYRAILENSPGIGFQVGAGRSRFTNTNITMARIHPIKQSAGGRTSLFGTPNTSPAISKTRYDYQYTRDQTQ